MFIAATRYETSNNILRKNNVRIDIFNSELNNNIFITRHFYSYVQISRLIQNKYVQNT